MSYHSLYDIKRDRLPYTSGGQVWIRPTWAPEITNSFYKNIKKSRNNAVQGLSNI